MSREDSVRLAAHRAEHEHDPGLTQAREERSQSSIARPSRPACGIRLGQASVGDDRSRSTVPEGVPERMRSAVGGTLAEHGRRHEHNQHGCSHRHGADCWITPQVPADPPAGRVLAGRLPPEHVYLAPAPFATSVDSAGRSAHAATPPVDGSAQPNSEPDEHRGTTKSAPRRMAEGGPSWANASRAAIERTSRRASPISRAAAWCARHPTRPATTPASLGRAYPWDEHSS